MMRGFVLTACLLATTVTAASVSSQTKETDAQRRERAIRAAEQHVRQDHEREVARRILWGGVIVFAVGLIVFSVRRERRKRRE